MENNEKDDDNEEKFIAKPTDDLPKNKLIE
jgi:hypothetical protein